MKIKSNIIKIDLQGMVMKKNIVVYGGSFDPIHQGHLTLLQSILQEIPSEIAYLIPTGSHPYGKNYFFTEKERLLMLKAVLGFLSEQEKKVLSIDHCPTLWKDNRVKILDSELYKKTKSYTIESIKILKKIHPQHDFHLLVGADQAEDFSSWHRVEELCSLVQLWTFPRTGYQPQKEYNWNFLSYPELEISSSAIKEMIYKDQDLNHPLIPCVVKTLIPYFLTQKNRE